jgi:hypothetical protein
MRRAILIGLFGGLVYGLSATPASARKEYFDEFKEKYGSDDAEYGKLIEDTKCFICHVGKSKKNRNEYGMALSKVIKKEKDKAKISAALGKIESEKSADGTTFGELIKEHKLPTEPKKED